MFVLPSMHIELDKASLLSLRTRFPAQYEKVISTPRGFTRFYSNTPCLDISAFVQDHHPLAEHCFYAAPINGDGVWYGLLIEHGLVRAQQLGSMNELLHQFGFELTQVTTICTTSDFVMMLTPSLQAKVEILIPPDFSECGAHYALPARKKRTLPKWGLTGLCLGLIGYAGISVVYDTSSSAPPVLPVSPMAQYDAEFSSLVFASDVFDMAYRASAYALLLPQDWIFTNVHYDNKTLRLNYEESPHSARVGTMHAFISRHPALASAWERSAQYFTWSLDNASPPERYEINPVSSQLKDTLINLGFHVSESTMPALSDVPQTQWTLTQTGASLTLLHTLSQLTAQLPVFVHTLDIQKGLHSPNVNITAEVIIKGYHHDPRR